jgi:DNA/RNA-binding domain of Phe-tRNA-synthetase-like protein
MFSHAPEIWADFPELAAGVLTVEGLLSDGGIAPALTPLHARARARLAAGPEGEFPEIQAWRRAFAKLGVKPTQYRCASEALLRRFRQTGEVPTIHPLIDLCNAVSLATALPIAVFDLALITGTLTVRFARGDEHYEAFSGEVESPPAGEVIFADAAGNAHARRWCNRQSRKSAVASGTDRALIVVEALHAEAAADVQAALDLLVEYLGPQAVAPARLSQSAPLYRF